MPAASERAIEGAARAVTTPEVGPRLRWSSPAGRVKRAMDVLLGAVLLVLVSPVLLVIDVLIKLTSPGPILY